MSDVEATRSRRWVKLTRLARRDEPDERTFYIDADMIAVVGEDDRDPELSFMQIVGGRRTITNVTTPAEHLVRLCR